VCRMVKVVFSAAATPRPPYKRIVAAATTERARNSRRDGVSLPTRSCCRVVFIVVSFQRWLGFSRQKTAALLPTARQVFILPAIALPSPNVANMNTSHLAALLAGRIHTETKYTSTVLTRSTSNTGSSNGMLSQPRGIDPESRLTRSYFRVRRTVGETRDLSVHLPV